MGGRKPRLPRGNATASSVCRNLWESSLDACFLLRCERDAAGHITDLVFADMNPRGAATLCAVAPLRAAHGLPVAKTSNGWGLSI